MGNVVHLPLAANAAVVAHRPKQNWVLDPFQDSLFIIFAPIIVVALALIPFHTLSIADATALVIVTHIVMTVAHHLPTFIRIYGDVDLFKRFKWSFVLGPVVPLIFSTVVLVYINLHDYPVEYFLYLYIMLALWDPWHFLRQHYGFMRIYDRSNAAPKSVAANMDLWLCVAWFSYIMLSSGAWLPETLHDLYASTNIPIMLSVTADGIAAAASVMQVAAFAMTFAYGAYLFWCWKNRYFISAAKIGLLLGTFGVMYLTYTPNAWMQSLAPGWTFKVGFAVVGVVHMTQYLAIVWRYNRSLAKSPERSRGGVFRRWHAQRSKIAWVMGAAYVGVCLGYGEIVTTRHDNRLLMSVLLAVGFTSTLMHYYFDGFIWKVRHQQNREALAMADVQVAGSKLQSSGALPTNTPNNEGSWWTNANRATASGMLLRQTLYFGLPMLVLTIGALAVWQSPNQYYSQNYISHMYNAQSLAGRGLNSQAEQEAHLAFAAMNGQLPFATKMAELQPTAALEAELAFLIYNQSLYENVLLPQLAGKSLDASRATAHRSHVEQAVALMGKAVEQGEPLSHSGREKLTHVEAQAVVNAWRRQLGQ
jgi:hypothetical protein